MSTPYNPNISYEDNHKRWRQETIERIRKAYKEAHEKYGTYCDICTRDLSEYGAGPYRKINSQWHCYDCAPTEEQA